MNMQQGAARIAAGIAGLQAAAACLLLPVPVPGRVAAAGGILVLVVLFAVRLGGRTLPCWVLARSRFRRRTVLWRGYRPRWPIEFVVPGVDTRGIADRAGNRVGLVTDGAGWTGVLRLDPLTDRDLVGRLREVMDVLADAVTAEDSHLDGVQLVGWSVPAPSQPTGGPVALRTFWVAARFDGALHPVAVAARGGGEQGAVRAAAAAVLRLATSLRQLGYGLRVLDGTELVGELGTSLGLATPARAAGQPVTAQGRSPSAEETWRWWSLGALHHMCFRLRRPPREAARLAAWCTVLANAPAVTTCVSVLFARDAGRRAASVVVRVAVAADRDPRAVRGALRRATSSLRGGLTPIHGEHLLGVRATIPLAATP